MNGKKAQMTLATSRWMEIFTNCLGASSVGEQLALDLQADPTGDMAERTLRSVFGVKSPATISKTCSEPQTVHCMVSQKLH